VQTEAAHEYNSSKRVQQQQHTEAANEHNSSKRVQQQQMNPVGVQ
jgi:hypothetical protein